MNSIALYCLTVRPIHLIFWWWWWWLCSLCDHHLNELLEQVFSPVLFAMCSTQLGIGSWGTPTTTTSLWFLETKLQSKLLMKSKELFSPTFKSLLNLNFNFVIKYFSLNSSQEKYHFFSDNRHSFELKFVDKRRVFGVKYLSKCFLPRLKYTKKLFSSLKVISIFNLRAIFNFKQKREKMVCLLSVTI